MTTLINANDKVMKIKGSFNDAKSYMLSQGATVRESRTCENGYDVFINGKMVGVLLYDGQTEKQLITF